MGAVDGVVTFSTIPLQRFPYERLDYLDIKCIFFNLLFFIIDSNSHTILLQKPNKRLFWNNLNPITMQV